MKKLFAAILLIVVCSTTVYAQEDNAAKNKGEMHHKMAKENKEMSHEMRREKFHSLSPEKQQAVKIEMKRHRAEMKKITGKS